MALDIVVMAGGAVHLADGWGKLWSSLTSAAPGVTDMMNTVGVLLMVGAFFKFLWDKRKNGGGDMSKIVWTAAFGAAMSAPGMLMPILLKVIDWCCNFALAAFNIA